MKFTPGPWACDFTSVWQEDGGVLVAVCGDAYPRGDNHPTENMRLISAAPEMYQALCEAAGHLESLENSVPGERVLSGSDLNAIGTRAFHLRRVIAKAEGKEL